MGSTGASWVGHVKSGITEWAGCAGGAVDVAVGNSSTCGGCEHI